MKTGVLSQSAFGKCVIPKLDYIFSLFASEKYFLNAHVLILCSQVKYQMVTDRYVLNQLAVFNLFLPAAFMHSASIPFIDIMKYVLMLFYMYVVCLKSSVNGPISQRQHGPGARACTCLSRDTSRSAT